jgi:hypothetical protein
VTVRFLADENYAPIMDGLRSREPTIDILDVKTAGLRGTKDPALLDEIAGRDRRVVGKPIPGVFLVPDRPSAIGDIIEWLVLVWSACTAEEWRDRIEYVRTR